MNEELRQGERSLSVRASRIGPLAMAAHDPTVRVLCARIAAAERWAREPDRIAATAAARRGLRAKFERRVDPDQLLSEADRTRRVDGLMRAHMLRLSHAAAKARARKAGRVLPS